METLGLLGPLGVGAVAVAPVALIAAGLGRRASARLLRALRELLTSKSFLLSAGAFSLIAAGALLNSATAAYFTATQAATGPSIASATLSLNAPTFVAFTGQKLVPGDMLDKQITIANSNSIAATYYLTTFATASSALDNAGADALRMVWLRCGTDVAPADCAAATAFQTVSGVMNSAAATVTTSGGPPAAAGLSVSGTSMTFTQGAGGITSATQTIAGVPLLTKNNTGNANCSTTNDGGCLLGGDVSGLNNPATTVAAGSGTVDIPALSNVRGVSAGHTDRFLVYVFLPTGADQATFGGASSTLTFAFTAVQPAGAFEPTR